MSLADRFWTKVDKSGECWIWTGATVRGYGSFHLAGRTVIAHRIAWLLEWGEIPHGVLVCHRCDNPACVRPAHLFLGSMADNMGDMARKGRSAHGSRNHHAKITEADAIAIKRSRLLGCDLATIYGISEGRISEIRSGKRWSRATGLSA